MRRILNKIGSLKKIHIIGIGIVLFIVVLMICIKSIFVTLPIIKSVDDSRYVYSSSEKKAIINYVTAVTDYYNGIVLGKYDLSESSERLKSTSKAIDSCIDKTPSDFLLQTCYFSISLCDLSISSVHDEFNEALIDSIDVEKNGKIKCEVSFKVKRELRKKVKNAVKTCVKACLK